MVTVPLGVEAYSRQYAGEPEIRLVNRYLEQNPTNLREKIALITRPGSNNVLNTGAGTCRGNFSDTGLFDGDLFTVYGTQLFRVSATSVTPITGTLAENGFVYMTWMNGIGYQFLFISDGQTVWYYTTHAMGFLTVNAGGDIITDWASGGQVIQINGIYYAWSAVVDPGIDGNPGTPPDGTSAHPYLALLGTTTPDSNGFTLDESSLSNMVMLLGYTGISADTYSQTVPGPSAVTAVLTGDLGDTLVMAVTSIVDLVAGNFITTTVQSGSGMAWGAATLTGGGGNALQQVTGMGDAEVPKALTQVSSYVLVSVGNTQKFYWLEPGQVQIDPLNFASKESNPDNISDMVTIGDQAMICGDGSVENWYATGTFTAPFAPVEGRVYARGTVAGTAIKVKDSFVLVGDDLIVYTIGYTWGDTSQYGVHRISTHGIEERIRTQVRALQGLTP